MAHVNFQFTAHDWEIWSEHVARVLTQTLNEAINSGQSRQEVLDAVDAAIDLFPGSGAWDSEPRNFLYSVLDLVFNIDTETDAFHAAYSFGMSLQGNEHAYFGPFREAWKTGWATGYNDRIAACGPPTDLAILLDKTPTASVQ